MVGKGGTTSQGKNRKQLRQLVIMVKKMRFTRASIAGALLSLLVPTAFAVEEGQGYLDLRASAFPGASGDKLQLIEELRPSFTASLGERFKLVATLDLSLSEGRNTTRELERTIDQSSLGPLLQQCGCVWPKQTNDFFRISSASDYLEVDRLYLDYYSERLDVRAGRQALHWGSAQFFNPTDPFPEVLITEPWRPRRGVNALRAHLAFGPLIDATAVAALDDSLTRPRAALRLRTNRWGVDMALSGVWRGDEDWLAGLDVRGTLGVGFWLEAALRPTSGTVHEELAAGLDYSFEVFEKLVLMAQYYRNGAGAASPDQYVRTVSLAAAGPTCSAGSPLGPAQPDPFAPFTLARDYLLLSTTATLTPELTFSLPLLQNLDDGTAIAIPTVTWSAANWLDLSLSAQVPFTTWGNGGEFKPRPGDLLIQRNCGPLGAASADLAGLVPAATVTLWTRASF